MHRLGYAVDILSMENTKQQAIIEMDDAILQ